MTDALKLVAVISLLFGFVLLAAFITPGPESTALSCVTGEEAQNPLDDNGAEKVAWQEFASIDAAEAYLCVDLPQPQALNGWEFVNAMAWRTNGLDQFDTGQFVSPDGGYKRAVLHYGEPSEGTGGFALSIYPVQSVYGRPHEGFCTGEGATQEFAARIQGQEVPVFRGIGIEGQSHLVACWQHGDLQYFADAEFRGQPDPQPSFVQLLESIE